MKIEDILSICDHTLLLQTATWPEIKDLCDDAMKYHTASVCIPPCYVKQAADYMQGRIKVCTVIGFPNGNCSTATKVFETKDAIENGADEIDMVINVGWLKAKQYDLVLDEIKQITQKEVLLYSSKAKYVSGTDEAKEDYAILAERLIVSEEEYIIEESCAAFAVEIDGELEYVIIMPDIRDTVVGKLAACQIKNLVVAESDRYDRNNFMQNIILGNMLNVDIINRAKKLHIDNRPRAVYVIDTGKNSNEIVLELVKNLSNLKGGDFVVSVDEHSVVLVKDVGETDRLKLESRLRETADSLVDNILTEAMIKVRVGYSNLNDALIKIADSFQEAKLALEVGRVFYAEKEVISYEKLGIGRLIYQLPMSLCEMFIREVFGENVPEILDDEEAMSTIAKFFENNLNISETARQLYVHRNTLVYRLERIEKAIGLDIRTFDDAMTFKIATMVLAHIRDNRR